MEHHIHRPGHLKTQNKAHKHWHKSKRAIDKLNNGRTIVHKFSKKVVNDLKRKEKRNQAEQARKKKRFEYLQKRRGFCEAPFLVFIVPLHEDITVEDAIDLLKTADPEGVVNNTSEGYIHLMSPRIKHKFTFVNIQGDNLFDYLDVAKVCTTVLFLTSVKGVSHEILHIPEGIFAQGLPTYLFAVTDLNSLPQKKQNDAKASVQQDIESIIPGAEKVMQLSRDVDAMNILRKIAMQKQRTLLQRDRRPHMLAESCNFVETTEDSGMLSVTGYLRGRNLSANSLVHIPGWGTYQIDRIETAAIPGDSLAQPEILEQPDPLKQESLVSENIPDPMDAEQTWPTEEDMELCSVEKVKKIAKGMSQYQAAWIPDEDAIDLEEYDDDDADDDGLVELKCTEMSAESESESEYDQFETATMASEAPPDPDVYDENMDFLEEKDTLEQIRSRAKEDLEFPDEMDTPQNIPARERFARYRALASFRTTPWHTKENLPIDYAKIFQFHNFSKTKSAVLAAETDGVLAGSYITVYVKDVPSALYHLTGKRPIVLYGMLPHEQKLSVLNVVLKRLPGFNEPIPSKESLLFQVGYRRFRAAPIFSQHTKGNKFKYERFFQSDCYAIVATVYAPVIFPPATVLVYKENEDRTITPVAHGTFLSVDPDRIIVKRVVLSGHPLKIHKRSAVIRYMFFNREDVEWFKKVELRTKGGIRGNIKEPLGTHGHMKCVFEKQLQSNDTALLYLYKRIFPKWTYDPCVTFAPLT